MGKTVKEFVRDGLVMSTFRVMTACYQFHGCIIFCVNIVSGGGNLVLITKCQLVSF